MLLSVKAILGCPNAKGMFSCFDNEPLHGTPSQDYDIQIKNVVFVRYLFPLHILTLDRSIEYHCLSKLNKEVDVMSNRNCLFPNRHRRSNLFS